MDQRVWDRFLSEQDREDLKTRARVSGGFGERPALLLVDLYRAVFGDRPLPLAEARKEWPSSCGLVAWDALPHLVRLRDAARAAGIPIVYSRDDPNSPIIGWPKSSGIPSGAQPTDDKWRRRFDIVDEIAPRPEDVVITKDAPSAFFSTSLLAHLVSMNVDTVIVGGESTSGCLRATVVDGRSYRFKMIVVEEGAFDRHEACHAINLFDLNQKYADVLSIDEVVGYLQTFERGARIPRSVGPGSKH